MKNKKIVKIIIILITTLGRFPSIITSTLIGTNLGNQNYKHTIITFIITAILSLAGILIYKTKVKKKANNNVRLIMLFSYQNRIRQLYQGHYVHQ